MPEAMAQRPIRVGMVSLGCAKNLVDAEVMLGCLARDGMEITSEAALADVLIINTCSFIDSAKEESIDTILQHAQVREAQHRGQVLVVAGCLPQRFSNDLPALMPEVDGFMGLDQVTQAPQIVRQAMLRARPLAGVVRQPKEAPHRAAPLVVTSPKSLFVPDYSTPRFRLTPRHTAYVKIAEGCNHPCSFCIIPRIRGSHRSRQLEDIVAECRQLVAGGVKELNLISQDTTYYGLDLRTGRRQAATSPAQFASAVKDLSPNTPTLETLIRELNKLPGEFWVRILYTHPAHWTDGLIETLAQCSKVARYIDIPLQHIHPVMLERMRRETSREYLIDLLARMRRALPGMALRTTFLVGFPGETEEHFSELMAFIQETRFERLGVFTYSPEDGTRAAKMSVQLPERIKKSRRNRAMRIQQQIARQHNQDLVGSVLRVLTERVLDANILPSAEIRSWEHGLVRHRDSHARLERDHWVVARSQADAPDIDGQVFIRGQAPLGEFVNVRVKDHTDYDLIAELA
jgi:ribosomal protein S12 methylthiotransferase